MLLVVLAAVESAGTRLPWRRGKGTPVAAAGFDELGAVFSGGKREEMEYRKMSLVLRDDEDDGAPPRGSVDLDGFGVRVVLPERD
ncbi:hypothetical protein CLV40_1349 [Actinokineospora auranticolor]|uniref:Uncharacterized protein n=1 Tax=Actinokineospora auranticolor TaxID=155976 RepID=A0A2S6GCG6_9PSEU|nr:hypothetical protein CLV40_1349 [Actinokineospora auranticolor]